MTFFIGESVQAHAYLLWEALFLFAILVINFAVALNEEYLYRNEIPHRVKKVLGGYNIFFFTLVIFYCSCTTVACFSLYLVFYMNDDFFDAS